MPNALLIAEKPSLRRTIEEVYNNHRKEIPYDITFKDQRGHLLTLMLPQEIDPDQKVWAWENLPFNPEEHGGFKYKIIEEKKQGKFLTAKERYADIKKTLKEGNFDFIINAGDPDQEGELLVWLVIKSLRNKLPVKRFWTNDLAESSVLKALKNLRDDEKDPQLVNLLSAAYARQRSDYRVGMNLSEACSLKMGSRVAVGRVKTPIQAIVCKREDEIKNFTPKTVYGVSALYDKGFEGNLFDEKKIDEEDPKDEKASYIYFDTKEEAKDLINSLPKEAVVKSYEKKQVKTLPPKFFKLATAQIAAGKLGYTSSQTLSIIQSLYEKKFLSYPRTDCEYLSSSDNLPAMLRSAGAVDRLKPFISSITASDISRVRGTKKWINDEKLKDSGHSSLVPTTVVPDMDSLSHDEQVIYTLVARQFVAAFLPPLVEEKTTVITDIGGHSFKSQGKTVVDKGYTVIFGTKLTDTEIPVLSKGDKLGVDNFNLTEKTSQCPKRFSDADLIAVCESPAKFLDDKSLKSLGKELKIGTPATRASIIEGLITKDHYLKRVKEGKTEKIVPTEAGEKIYENIKDFEFAKVDMTGHWELSLEAIREGKMSFSEMEDTLKHDIASVIEDIRTSNMKGVSQNKSRNIIGTCPKCGGSIISADKNFYCSSYRDGCRVGAFKKIADSKITDKEFLTMLSGEVIEKELRKGDKKWKQQLKYDFEQKKIVFVEREKKEVSLICPVCGKNLYDNGFTLSCECGFRLYKNVCKKDLSAEEIQSILSGKKTFIKGMTSKKGKKFDAYLKLSSDKKKTEFEFK